MPKWSKSVPELHHHPTLLGNMDIRHSLPHAQLAGERVRNLDQTRAAAHSREVHSIAGQEKGRSKDPAAQGTCKQLSFNRGQLDGEDIALFFQCK